jgi:hypothetical protein
MRKIASEQTPLPPMRAVAAKPDQAGWRVMIIDQIGVALIYGICAVVITNSICRAVLLCLRKDLEDK